MKEKMVFKTLTPEQETDFRQWARDNYNESVKNGDLNNPLWHPVIRDEFGKILDEKIEGVTNHG